MISDVDRGGEGTTPAGGGFRLNSRQNRQVTLAKGNGNGRIWGRTGCNDQGANCDTGNCGGGQGCRGRGGRPPASLTEMNMKGHNNQVGNFPNAFPNRPASRSSTTCHW